MRRLFFSFAQCSLSPSLSKPPPKRLTATLERVLEAPPALSRTKLRRQRSTLVTRGCWGVVAVVAAAAEAVGATSAAAEEERQARAAEAASSSAVDGAGMMKK